MIGRTLPALTIAVLAAGLSNRLGQPKALAAVNGSSLLKRTLAILKPLAGSTAVLVIVPPAYGRYRRAAGNARVRFVPNADRAAGMSTSVHRAIAGARHSAGLLLIPVDLVRLDSRDLARLISRWRGRRRQVVARRMGTHAVTPLILPSRFFERALIVRGDQGLREWVRRLPAESVSLLSLPSARRDVDTPAQLAAARRRRSN